MYKRQWKILIRIYLISWKFKSENCKQKSFSISFQFAKNFHEFTF